MTGANGAKPAETPPPANRRIIIELGPVPGMHVGVALEGQITTLELYGAAWFLDAYAHETRAGEAARAAGVLDPAALLRSMGLGSLRAPGQG